MTVFNIYKLNDDDQLDIFFSKHDGKLDLQKVTERMYEFASPSFDFTMNINEIKNYFELKVLTYNFIKYKLLKRS